MQTKYLFRLVDHRWSQYRRMNKSDHWAKPHSQQYLTKYCVPDKIEDLQTSAQTFYWAQHMLMRSLIGVQLLPWCLDGISGVGTWPAVFSRSQCSWFRAASQGSQLIMARPPHPPSSASFSLPHPLWKGDLNPRSTFCMLSQTNWRPAPEIFLTVGPEKRWRNMSQSH